MRGAQHPPRFRSRGQRLRRHPQQQAGDAGRLRGQRQFAARHQIELPGLAPELEHDGAERIAGERIGRGAQRALDVSRPHHHHAARIEAELGEPAHRQRAGLELRKILPHPQKRPLRRDAARKPGDKAGRNRALTPFAKHLVDRRACESAFQGVVHFAVTERNAVVMMPDFRRLDPLDLAAQGRKRAHACAAHARRSFRGDCRCLSKREPPAGSFVHDMF